jgi:hypothetical protein
MITSSHKARAARGVLPSAAALLACAPLLGCSTRTASSTTAMWVVPSSLADLSAEHFFDQPWPSDLRLENGSPRFEGYFNPKSLPLLDQYVGSLKGELDGFSPAAAGYLRFSDPIDPSSLPATPKDALDESSSVQLIDIDPRSPERGRRKLVSVQWRAEAGVYYQTNTLAFMPTIGFPLRPHTRYALVVTSALQAEKGGAVGQSTAIADLVSGAATTNDVMNTAAVALAPAIAEIEGAGIDRGDIVHFTVFTTADPTAELSIVRDGVARTIVAPTAEPDKWAVGMSTADFDEYQGRYSPAPNYQAGTIPYAQYGDGGNFVIADGKPVLQNVFDMRFSIAVPNPAHCPMPAAGYPVVLYAHGTGGDWRSYIADGTAQVLTQHCMAAMGVDQIFHGDRPGAPPDDSESQEELLFFNFQNPTAARTNGRQSAIDEVQRARLFTESHLVIPGYLSFTHAPIRFDANKLLFFGHSQGGLNGPLFSAVDPSIRGAVFSGSGAEIAIALLEKTDPSPSVAALFSTLLLGLNAAETSELDVFHPEVSMIQSLIDVTDPLHYGRMQAADPRPGFAPKSIYMTEGINPDGTGDTYAPPHGIEAHAISIGLPVELPEQRAIAESKWGGPQPVRVPSGGLSGDLARGDASGVLGQWAVPAGDDGHFVVFDVPSARTQAAVFLQNLIADPQGLVPPPGPGVPPGM